MPDEITAEFVNRRKNPKYKRDSAFYQPDEDAEYAETHIIDLSQVEPFVARYPNPDDVVPVGTVSGTKLDGCFIGACTTAEEDLILAGLLLRAGLESGMKPVPRGKRKVSPGSRPILHNLRQNGLLRAYQDAGFEIGVPGCSYCVGMGADKAGEGEIWLSSQNRNFENRMGPGTSQAGPTHFKSLNADTSSRCHWEYNFCRDRRCQQFQHGDDRPPSPARHDQPR